MQETNEKKLKKILNANSGYITRKQVDTHKIPSWFLTDFVRRQGLVKIDKGFYAQEQWIRDRSDRTQELPTILTEPFRRNPHGFTR